MIKIIRLHRHNLWVLFFLLYLIIHINCGKVVKKNSNIASDEWGDNPSIVLSLSRAIIDGMHHLMEELLISELGFIDTDITIVSGGAVILKAKITRFTLQNVPTAYIFTRWRIFRKSYKNLEYINTIKFDNIEYHKYTASKNLNLTTLPDSLFLDIYESSSKFFIENKALPRLEIVFWRNASKNDRLATLQMSKNLDNTFIVNHAHGKMVGKVKK